MHRVKFYISEHFQIIFIFACRKTGINQYFNGPKMVQFFVVSLHKYCLFQFFFKIILDPEFKCSGHSHIFRPTAKFFCEIPLTPTTVFRMWKLQIWIRIRERNRIQICHSSKTGSGSIKLFLKKPIVFMSKYLKYFLML